MTITGWVRTTGLGVLVVAGALLMSQLAGSASAAGGATLGVEPLKAQVGHDDDVEVTVGQVPEPGLGAWTVDVVYDSALLTLQDCDPYWGGICNPEFEDDTIRIAGVSVSGLVGDDALGMLTFACKQAGEAEITLKASIFADATPGNPQPMDVKIKNGQALCSEEPLAKEGDADCDGDVDVLDAALVLQYVAGLLADLPCEADVDINDDGSVDSVDASLILQIVAGLI